MSEFEQKWLDKFDETLTGIENSLEHKVRGYIKTLENIVSRELNLIDTRHMAAEEQDYFKGRISAFEAVIDDLAIFLGREKVKS